MAEPTNNTTGQISDAPAVNRTTLLMVGVFVVIFVIGVFMIGKFFFFDKSGAAHNANVAEGNVGP